METRTALQIALAAIVLLVVGLGGYIVWDLTRDAETTVVTQIVEVDDDTPEYVNPWSQKGDAAALLVKRVAVKPPLFPPTPEDLEKQKKKKKKKKRKRRKKTKKDDEEQSREPPEGTVVTLEQVMERDDFVKETLKLKGQRVGWKAEWWGETKFGPSFFLVRYVFKDADTMLGPAWLVDLKTRTVVPKNLYAEVAQNPTRGVKSDYYDKNVQIVSAIARHRFAKGMSLAGALLVYFEEKKSNEEDTIDGWTVDHDRGSLFRAVFQWVEEGAPTYAEFEFDFDRKALKPVNLQAANIMRVGEEFDRERVSIMPGSYDPNAKRASQRWKGPARKACRKRANRSRCDALATMLDQTEVVESLEWLLTARSEGPDQFAQCKAARECSWRPKKDEGKYTIKYVFKLGDGPERIVKWQVDPKSSEITPLDRISKLAFSAIRPR